MVKIMLIVITGKRSWTPISAGPLILSAWLYMFIACMPWSQCHHPIIHTCVLSTCTALPTKPTQTPQVKGRQEVSLMPAP